MNNYWEIHGNKYDLSKFVEKHPGGSKAILSGKGIDCTALFESYHPWNYEKACSVLSKYGPEIKEEKNGTYSKLRYLINSVMSKEESKWSWFELFSYNFMILMIIGLLKYISSCFYSFILGMGFTVFGFRMIHEAGHFSISTKPLVNEFMQWPSIIIGGTTGWHMQHVIGHHILTNQENDPDTHVVKKIQEKNIIIRIILYALLIPLSVIQIIIHPLFILYKQKTVGVKLNHLSYKRVFIELGLSIILHSNLNWTLYKFLSFINFLFIYNY